MAFVVGALEFHAFYFTPPKYSLRGGVGLIIQLTHFICSILAYLPTILSLLTQLASSSAHHDINMSTPTPFFNYGGQLSLLLQSGRLTRLPPSIRE